MMAAAERVGMALAALMPECPAALSGLWVGDLALSSREVRPGALFLAVPGTRGHGLDHLAEAQARGAAAVAWEPDDAHRVPPPASIPMLAVPQLKRRIGSIADRFFGEPSAGMQVLAVTGTNGKTTVSWLLAQALEMLGHPCGYCGTLGAGRPGELVPAALTTPDAVTLHRWLAREREHGVRSATLEASSHALDQGRLDGVRVKLAVFTNLTPEHLDYHHTMEAYGEAKARLFRRPELEHAVIQCDDPFASRLLSLLPEGAEPVRVNGPGGVRPLRGRWLRGGAIERAAATLAVHWRLGEVEGRIDSRLTGGFNASNLLLALGALIALGVEVREAARVLSAVSAPPGRMESFGGAPQAPLVVVDFAHTPDALERVLSAMRETLGGGRLTCVFGCGGDRDRSKRPRMGALAARLADRVILTSDNPRSEHPAAILAEIRAGIQGRSVVEEVPERRAAIYAAVTEAEPGDAVLIAGRGHETVQAIGDLRLPLDDRTVVRCALEARR